MLTKKRMKLLLLALSVLLLLVLFACTQPNDPTETDPIGTQAPEVTETDGASETDLDDAETTDPATNEPIISETTVIEPPTEETTEPLTEETTELTTEETTEPEETEPVYTKQDWEEDGVLKILCLGNSFSVDTMEYLYGILKDLGVEEIKLGNLAIAGCSLSTHYANAQSDAAEYLYYENTTGTWKSGSGYVMSDIIKSENWDFISLQQASHDSGVESTYGPLSKLIDIIEPQCPGARLVWNMTWAYQQDATHGSFPVYNKDQMTMYGKIVSTVQAKVLTETSIEKVNPAGTAIQNARAGWIGDTLTKDGFHLTNTGRYIAALTFAQTLTGKSVENVTYAPVGLTAAEQTLAIEAAMLAVKKPFDVSTPTAEAPDVPSIEDLYELEIEFDRGYYHACEPGGRHFNRLQGSDLANKFYSTQIFTKETLPAGSIILIAEGWQYRPESWLGDEQLPTNLRPAGSVDTMIVVDDLWWGDFTFRAFNLSKTPQVSLLDMTAEDMKEVIKIYVPYDPSTVEPEPEPEPEDPLAGLYELTLNFESGYWHACEPGGGHFTRLQGSDLANKFYSSQIFTKEQLPVGTVIILADGWQYRPKSWLEEAQLIGARPNNTTTAMVVVDEAWWGDFTLRAFNLSKKGLAAIDEFTAEDMKEIIKIYVPYDPSTLVPWTPSVPEPEPEPDDPLAGLYELTLDFQRGYYAATTGGGKHLEVIYNDSDLANSFYSTQILTKEQLPVGCVIVLADGWQYRPEGWIGDAQLTTARPATVKTTMVVVDEAWWGDFTLRAFNVQKNPSASLVDYTAEDMKEVIKIYVPYDPSAQGAE